MTDSTEALDAVVDALKEGHFRKAEALLSEYSCYKGVAKGLAEIGLCPYNWNSCLHMVRNAESYRLSRDRVRADEQLRDAIGEFGQLLVDCCVVAVQLEGALATGS